MTKVFFVCQMGKANLWNVHRKILCYGDSNTYGYDPRSYLGGQYPDTVRWTALLEQQGWKVFNAGENGRSIPRCEWEVETALQAIRQLKPDIVTIMLGSNDLLQSPDLSAEDCALRMEHFLKKLLEYDFSCEYLLIAPPQMALGAWVGDKRIVGASRALSECYKAAAHRLGIHFADAGTWDVSLAFDGVHFSEGGHSAFANGLYETLVELSGDAE